MGAQVLLWDAGERLTVAADGRAGVFGNAAAQHSRYDFGVVTETDRGSTTPVSFLGEIGVTAGYRLSQRWSAQAGYRLMWINQLALATDGVAASDFLFGGGIDASGDTFYHGATVGLQYIR